MKERGLLLPPRVCPDGRARERPELLLTFPRAGQLAMGLRGQRGQGALVLSIDLAFQLLFLPPLHHVEGYKPESATATYGQYT